jgi:hypothetical protein
LPRTKHETGPYRFLGRGDFETPRSGGGCASEDYRISTLTPGSRLTWKTATPRGHYLTAGRFRGLPPSLLPFSTCPRRPSRSSTPQPRSFASLALLDAQLVHGSRVKFASGLTPSTLSSAILALRKNEMLVIFDRRKSGERVVHLCGIIPHEAVLR